MSPDFEPAEYRQWRFRVGADRVSVALEDLALGDVALSFRPVGVGLVASGAGAAFDMVRAAALP